MSEIVIFKNRICVICQRKTKQQFTSLFHCKCGMSYIKEGGKWKRFERTSDMVFKLNKENKAIITYN